MITRIAFARHICIDALGKQKEWNGVPLYTHSERVADLVVKQNPYDLITNKHIAAAWLHDVVEDTCMMASDLLRLGIGLQVVKAVSALTKPKKLTYQQYIQQVATNPIAVIVKIADLCDNSDMTRLRWPIDLVDLDRQMKYHAALTEMISVRNNHWDVLGKLEEWSKEIDRKG